MIKRYFLIIIGLFYFSNVYALDVRNINKSKIVSQASYQVNDTNLNDDDHAEDLLDKVKD